MHLKPQRESLKEINSTNINILHQKLGSYTSKNRREIVNSDLGRKSTQSICSKKQRSKSKKKSNFIWFIVYLGRKYEALKQDLQQQSNTNLAMRQCNEMLELKIQKLEAEKTKIMIENKYYQDKLVTNKVNKIEQKLFQKWLGNVIKNWIKKTVERQKSLAFSHWKTLMFRVRHYSIKHVYQIEIDKQTAALKLFYLLAKPYRRVINQAWNELRAFNDNLIHNSCPSISKDTSLSLLEDTEISKFDEIFKEHDQKIKDTSNQYIFNSHPNYSDQLKINAVSKIIYNMMLYQNKMDFERKKYAFKYWKVIHRSWNQR